MRKISVVIPAYNEEANLREATKHIRLVLENFCKEHANYKYEIIFVDDGSKDDTLEILESLSIELNEVKYLSLSRNFGHQHALKAGLDFADGACVISMDADLQHPPSLIPKLLEEWENGFDIVYTQRIIDKNLPFFKRITSSFFYKFLNFISDIQLEEGTADFRLLDKKVVDLIRQNQEYNFFLRGYISWMGFYQKKIQYYPAKRFAGQTKYSFKKMFSLALSGITSFSTKPLHLATVTGTLISFFAFLYGFYAIFMALFTDKAVSGWASLLVSVLFMGGLQLVMLGILGEYLGKLFVQSKNRPFYIIKKQSHNEQ